MRQPILRSMNFINRKGVLLLDGEESLPATLASGSRKIAALSPETRDWLACQSAINYLLSALANGESKRSFPGWIYQSFCPRFEFWRGHFDSTQNGLYTARLKKNLSTRRVSAKQLFFALKEAETFLAETPAEILTEPKSCAVGDHLAGESAPHPIVQELQKILLPLGNDVSVFMHGSMATGDFTPFSDVDDLVIIHQSAWSSFQRFREVLSCLERAAVFFNRFMPLQHHGHWIFSNFDLAALDQSTMPLLVLEKAICIAGPNKFTAKIRDSSGGLNHALWANIQTVRSTALSLHEGKINLYDLYHLVSGISLLPALTFQISGQFLDKKSAILQSAKIFSPPAAAAIGWATSTRQSWGSLEKTWMDSMRQKNARSPLRRDLMDKFAQRSAPMLEKNRVPFFTEEILPAITQLTRECAQQLKTIQSE